MIKKLNNKDEETALQIHSLFQLSYKIEAELLQVSDFPPLKRTLIDFRKSQTEFYGLEKTGKFKAIVEVASNKRNTNIDSLIVDPKYFRQGLASQLVMFVLKRFTSETFTVQTAAKNEPAVKLYRKLGFKEQEQFDSDIDCLLYTSPSPRDS